MSASEFESAVKFIVGNKAPKAPSQKEQLTFYGLFQQAEKGPNNTKEPSRLNIVARLKWQAWKDLGSISKDEAKKRYVQALDKITPNWRKSKL